MDEISRVSTLRHEPVFSPTRFMEKLGRPTLIGAGALGSQMAIELASLGLDLDVYDPDKIELCNIANQAYHLSQIGEFKAVAIADLAREKAGTDIRSNCWVYDRPRHDTSKVVILAVDRMETRKQIFETLLERNLRIRLLIDMRMGITSGISIAFDPNHPVHLRHFRHPSLYYNDDDVAPRTVGACGRVVSIKCTALHVVATAVEQLIQWYNHDYPDPDVEKPFEVCYPDNAIWVQWNPTETTTRRFE